MASADAVVKEAPPQTPFILPGKTAIVTGAGSGINLAFAELLLSNQANVVFADLALRPEAQKVLDNHSAKTSEPRAVFVKTDVTIWTDLERMFKVADEEFGGADLVCPGAGIFEPHWSNFWHPPGTSVSRDSATGEAPSGIGHYSILDINLTHPIRTTQLAIARWLNPAPGSKVGKVSPANPKRVVHISSVAGQLAGLTTPLYHVSKHGLTGFVRSLANLEQIGIRVVAVAPGLIMTPLWTENSDKMGLADAGSETWVGPGEVAEAMLAATTEEQWKGGSVVEITRGTRRKVGILNDPGPDRNELTGFGFGKGVAEVFGWLGEDGWGVPKQKD